MIDPMPVRVADEARTGSVPSATLAAGGRDAGAPGPRPHCAPHDDGAFVAHPEGITVEAVCRPPW